MGWDAYSVNGIGESICLGISKKDPKFNKHKKEFAIVSRQVNLVANGVDALLADGALDCTDCARMIEKACDVTCWTETPWTANYVQMLFLKSNWDFEFDEKKSWAYYSAKAFLETCAKLRLGITFSF